MLYSVEMVRPAPTTKIITAITGADEKPLASPITFGGEGRMAWIEALATRFGLPAAPELAPEADGAVRYVALLLTPAELAPPWPAPGTSLDHLPGTVVSAC